MGHDHQHEVQSFNKAFAIAIACNLGFTLVEVFYGVKANSVGLLGDAVHNFGDVFGLILAWLANWLHTKPAKLRYTYGYKRTSILAAIINALILVASSALIAWEAVYNLLNQSQVNSQVVISIAALGILINGGTALLFIKGSHEDLNIKGAFLHLLADALLAFGVVIAGILIYFTGHMWIDPLMGLIIVVIILWGTWGLLRDSVGLILDATPQHIDRQDVDNFLKQLPHVTAVHDLHIWGLSTREIALTAHLIMHKDHATDIDYAHINEVLKHQYHIDHVTIQVEIANGAFKCVHEEKC